ncbi:MAG: hypothetical protein A3F54_02910 [Candidatus Kerfeldbacteria bacterium RIFCSPHIGHO2_12_FULL_48_17]|uniref:Uncharacterized protein n=1 Tax=Candidatus Kerfeldbacteria bacterium RIFCSPHIGHO2_12_FULL_48_17 TaxID=1798542 RepID=A0A1G2BAV8_9BACT|nr:MAG: hypothetical protein A3F54_02910 [Candidatus Kerfeldbacteria bacterium RIFCSPHIGHO2_12_FULL_48_17]
MKVFLQTHREKYKEETKLLRGLIAEAGFEIMVPQVVDPRQHKPTGWYLQHRAYQGFQAFIIEMTEPTPEVTYLLAQAMMHHKPTLCLYQKGQIPREFLQLIGKKKTPDFIEFKAYNRATVGGLLEDFLHTLKSASDDPSVNIKFTLRMSQKTDQYLQWRAKQVGQSKADYLRDTLSEQMEADMDFRSWMDKEWEE